ncbi:MAG TPA: UDP-N-acetylmuramoyl-L-alanine--D-glutamate ligase [Candidatus Margulisiibacteriota bacterium]|nr:UDP-N-acetylmuramoyl-L-alanine--D-glutamate ligase [Candidatus Margulisiibacteriota bacterium]
MINTDKFKGKKVVIVGFARSGLACANLLDSLGAEVFVTDNKDSDALRRNLAQLKSRKIQIELGRHSEEFIKGKELLVISPGVPNDSSAVAWARNSGIPVISEIELAFSLCPAKVIAITGTNGKTTVTTLIGKVLQAQGEKVFICGNIGKPFCSEVDKMRESDFVSLEVSSFQLENIVTFKPRIAVVLNFSSNHLDRYNGLKDYLAAKKRIFLNQDNSDYLVINYDDFSIRGLAEEARSKVVYFRREEALNPNQSAVLVVASLLGISRDLVLRVFSEFKGVEHRMENVAEIAGVKFINDSKATTIDATIWALNNISSSAVLIAGGREKGNDYGLISELLGRKIKKAILIGEAKEKMKKAFTGIVPLAEAATLADAVRMAFQGAEKGECVLFSPMCKSFDMFSDYEERGRFFKEAVFALAKEKH